MISKKGFTLVELMVALAIALIITAGIAMFMMQLFDIKNSVLEEQKYLNEGRSALFLFARELQSLDPEASEWNENQSERLLFEGDADSLTFFSRDLTYKRFEIAPYNSRDRVFVYEEFVQTNNQAPEEEENSKGSEEQVGMRPLALEMNEIRFSYYDGEVWLDNWEKGDTLPRRIQLELIYGENEKEFVLTQREWLP